MVCERGSGNVRKPPKTIMVRTWYPIISTEMNLKPTSKPRQFVWKAGEYGFPRKLLFFGQPSKLRFWSDLKWTENQKKKKIEKDHLAEPLELGMNGMETFKMTVCKRFWIYSFANWTSIRDFSFSKAAWGHLDCTWLYLRVTNKRKWWCFGVSRRRTHTKLTRFKSVCFEDNLHPFDLDF